MTDCCHNGIINTSDCDFANKEQLGDFSKSLAQYR